jgi:hypothetical protein
MKWLTSGQPRAERPTWKRKCWSIDCQWLSHEPRTDQLDPIPSADGDTRWRGRFFIVTDHVDGHEEKSDGQGDVLGRVRRFCGLENIERVLRSQQEDVRQSLQSRSISGLLSIYRRPGPESVKIRTDRLKYTDPRALAKLPRQCRRCQQAWKARPLHFLSFRVSSERRFVVSTQPSRCNSMTQQRSTVKTTYQTRWVCLQQSLIERKRSLGPLRCLLQNSLEALYSW